MSRPLRLLCDANPMAYGSSSALLAIVDHTGGEHSALVGSLTAELLGRDPTVHETIDVDVKDTRAVAAVLDARTFDAVLVVANRNNLELYRSRGLPVFFVDVLFWYGADKRHPVWDFAVKAFVQDFPGVRERLAAMDMPRPPTVVGPVIRVPATRRRAGRALVNLGGVRSSFISGSASLGYLTLVADLLAAVADVLPPGPVTVACGADAAERLRGRLPPRFNAVTMPSAQYLDALAEAALLVTAPGINAVSEALATSTAVAFLPPQNVSQVFQLAQFEAAGLVLRGANLPEIVPEMRFESSVTDEGAYTAQVLEVLRSIQQSDDRQRAVAAHLAAQIRRSRDAESSLARRRFWDRFGGHGASVIGGSIRQWWQCTPHQNTHEPSPRH
jgi:hypothetical protein